MVFSSLIFLFRFLPFMLLIYFITPRRFRNFILLLLSLGFYAWGEPKYVIIMLLSTIIDYSHGILVDYFKRIGKVKFARITVGSSVIINIGILAVFKYADLFLNTLNQVMGSDVSLLKIALPIGVSFYTFQTMSYTIDVYRGNANVQKNIISFGTYVTMFPQLIAGPIVQYKTIENDINNRRENIDLFADGVRRFVIGLGKKVLLANNIGILWDTVKTLNIDEMPVLTAWLGIIAFAFQIYFDFSGYSDMAIGLGKMFGFNFNENFNYPYISKSITEFFRRWHISLGTWFREYVYIPLGGNRSGKAKLIFNILIVWLLTGLWHGASYNFILWGLYYGIILIIEKIFLRKHLENIPSVFRHIYTILIVLVGWVMFSLENMTSVLKYLKTMFGIFTQEIADSQTIYLLYTNLILIIILVLAATPIPKRLLKCCDDKINIELIKIIIKNLFYILIFLLSVAYLVDSTYNPFMYFRF